MLVYSGILPSRPYIALLSYLFNTLNLHNFAKIGPLHDH
ncbi:hypothetical protein GPLA_0326 [Paraglaciecola polaris LMG 21857]|uniref:Uncharacterized protein n=1 Tax=Paraglaciecola polaris LMG 21857 TaxID=1129793 RepID=K7A731_9ALTE|nr:hypothetical protein GPLA_0326 [Paraglaciecola polaris LMG 21857]